MGRKKRFEIGKLYEVEWIDHDQTESKSSKEAAYEKPVKPKSYGVYVGHNKIHHIFAYNFISFSSSNNDNMRILKKMITSSRELV